MATRRGALPQLGELDAPSTSTGGSHERRERRVLEIVYRRCAPAPPRCDAPWRGTPVRRGPSPARGWPRAMEPRARRRALTPSPRRVPRNGSRARTPPTMQAPGARPTLAFTDTASRSTTTAHCAPIVTTARSHSSVTISSADADATSCAAVSSASSRGSCSASPTGFTSSTSTTVDLCDLGDEQVERGAVGQLDHEVVDRAAAAALEDLDADDLAPHRADPAGDGTERTRPVGQPHAHRVGLHGREPYGRPVNGRFLR